MKQLIVDSLMTATFTAAILILSLVVAENFGAEMFANLFCGVFFLVIGYMMVSWVRAK